jgi:hypothetical protein
MEFLTKEIKMDIKDHICMYAVSFALGALLVLEML